jgi:enamine deaminase RidA (YjgF/YER057c/UK114 family)
LSGSVCATTAAAASAAGTEPLVQMRTVNPDSVAPPAGNYSHAVRLELDGAGLVFVSGQLPLDAQGRLGGEGDMARQTEGVSGLVPPAALLEVDVVAAGAARG